MADTTDLDLIHSLAMRVLEKGEALELTEETCALLRKSAREAAIDSEDVEAALRGGSTATTLLREIDARIRDGSSRLMRARDRVQSLRDKGDLRAARKLLEDLLAVEIVPLYRQRVAKMLEQLARLEAVATTGRVDPEVRPMEQLTVLVHRIEQGKGLELTDELRELLRRTAPSAAVGDAEAEADLESREGAEALIRKIVGRMRSGRHRITQALFRMTSLRDAGDLEGARQQMRDVLAVEVVPLYRRMAEENLAGLDLPPLKP